MSKNVSAINLSAKSIASGSNIQIPAGQTPAWSHNHYQQLRSRRSADMAAGGSTRAHAASAMFRDELASRRTRPNESARYQPYVRAARVEKSGDANSLLQVAEWTRARQPDTAGEGWQAAGEGYRCAQVRCSKRVFDNLAAGVSSRMEFSMRYAIFRKISTGTFGQVCTAPEPRRETCELHVHAWGALA
jgi:hypothetical protein